MKPHVWAVTSVDTKIYAMAHPSRITTRARSSRSSKEPAQKLAVTGETLWKLDRKTGLASWSGKAWSAIKF